MNSWIEDSLLAHRRVEALLDSLESAIATRQFAAAFRRAFEALAAHYAMEDAHLRIVGGSKLLRQHEEVLEFGAAVDDALARAHTSDALAMVKRFIALASHNLIEEERDWFPLW